VLIGAPTLVETAIALTSRLGFDGRPLLSRFMDHAAVQILPFTDVHASSATNAFFRYGRGHHPARLNFGDCLAYAIAAGSGMPLLFRGDDFAKTDLAR